MNIIVDVVKRIPRDREIELEQQFGIELIELPESTSPGFFQYLVQGDADTVKDFLKDSGIDHVVKL